MAYGQGDKSLLRRALPIGYETLTTGKHDSLLYLREQWCRAANTLVQAIWQPEPLVQRDAAEQEALLLAAQKAFVGLNKAYVEKARLAVATAVPENASRYLKRLLGKAMHCASRIPARETKGPARRAGKPIPVPRVWFNVSEGLQGQVTQADLDGLQTRCVSLKTAGTLALFRRVILEGNTSGLTPVEVLILRDLHQECQARYRQPVYGQDDHYTCQLHLDYRVMRGQDVGTGSRAADRIQTAARLLVDSGNACYQTFLEISNPVPGGEALRLPILLGRRVLAKLEAEASIRTLAIEIGVGKVTVKGILSKPKPLPAPLKGLKYLVGRDWGLVNTVSWSVVAVDAELSEAQLEAVCRLTKAEALAYLGSHSHDDSNVVLRERRSGRRFLDLAQSHCDRIDRVRSQLDLAYQKLEGLKANLKGHLGLGPEDLIPREAVLADPLAQRLLVKFFRVLDHLQHLKVVRRKVYGQIKALKKNWFGHCVNVEARLAAHFGAAVVHEALTTEAIPTDSPKYRGRTFNKMMNNGSKGQFMRRASDRHGWSLDTRACMQARVRCPNHSRALLLHVVYVPPARPRRPGDA